MELVGACGSPVGALLVMGWLVAWWMAVLRVRADRDAQDGRRPAAPDWREAVHAPREAGRCARLGAAAAGACLVLLASAGESAAAVWADVLTVADGELLERGKTRKQIDRTLRGKGLYLFVAAGMHSAATAKKAKGRAAARRKTVEEAARGRLSVAAHWPEHLPFFDAALRHAMLHPKPLLPPPAPPEPDR